MLYVNIKKRVGSFLLDLEFEANGETLALLGASGCGKSMTLKCIAGVETPDEGTIILNDRVLFDSKKKINLLPQHRKVGLLFQNYALFPNMTMRENIAIAIAKNQPNKDEIINKKIDDFSLNGLENNYPHQMSGGQQQRVALARMLVNEPEILMFDEPFSALDEHLRWQVEQELIQVLKQHKGSSLYVSHNKDEVYRISDRIAVLDSGSIYSINDKESLFNKPTNLNTAIITGCKNISKIRRIDKDFIHAIDWDLILKCDEVIGNDSKYVGIHATSIAIGSTPHKGTGSFCAENEFRLNIVDKINNIFSTILILSTKDNSKIGNSSLIYMEITNVDLDKNAIMENAVQVYLPSESLFLMN